jgi:hypothetical protein
MTTREAENFRMTGTAPDQGNDCTISRPRRPDSPGPRRRSPFARRSSTFRPAPPHTPSSLATTPHTTRPSPRRTAVIPIGLLGFITTSQNRNPPPPDTRRKTRSLARGENRPGGTVPRSTAIPAPPFRNSQLPSPAPPIHAAYAPGPIFFHQIQPAVSRRIERPSSLRHRIPMSSPITHSLAPSPISSPPRNPRAFEGQAGTVPEIHDTSRALELSSTTRSVGPLCLRGVLDGSNSPRSFDGEQESTDSKRRLPRIGATSLHRAGLRSAIVP